MTIIGRIQLSKETKTIIRIGKIFDVEKIWYKNLVGKEIICNSWNEKHYFVCDDNYSQHKGKRISKKDFSVNYKSQIFKYAKKQINPKFYNTIIINGFL